MLKLPMLCRHKASGQAVVRIDGKDEYCGKWGTEEAQRRYERLVYEWQAKVRRSDTRFFVVELIDAYLEWCESYYVKDGELTSQFYAICGVTKRLQHLYGDKHVQEFEPKDLIALRQSWIQDGLARTTINKYVKLVVRCFKWGVAHGHVEPSVLTGLQAVESLREGRCGAPEPAPVRPVDLETVQHTMTQLSPEVCDMVTLSLLSGMRPSETCGLTPGQLDRTVEPWAYTVQGHKMAHKKRQRIVYFGPRCQEILSKYLFRGDDERCFGLTARQYQIKIKFACKRLNIPQWSPNQLRHTKATDVRSKFGIDAARTVLGHTSVDMTERYAEEDLKQAREVAAKTG